MKLALDKAKAGSLFDIYENVRDKMDAGETLSDSVQLEIADRAIARYSTHIAAAFRKYDFNLQDGEVIDAEVLKRCLNEKAGLNIQHLTSDGVSQAVDAILSAGMSSLLGVKVSTVMDVAVLKQALIDGAIEAVSSGRATKLVSSVMIKKIRERKAWKAGGVEVVDQQKFLNRVAQKKYRRTHIGVWR